MANNAGFGITADFSKFDDLERMLVSAREKPAKVRAVALGRFADRAQHEAEAIAASYPSPIDELAASVEQEGTPLFRRVFTTARQGHFLHFGSPNTGAPRDWLHGPMQSAADDLFVELSKAAAPW